MLAASDIGRAEHAGARAALDDWPSRGTTLYTSGQVLREYLSVATRPEQHNGLGLSMTDTLGNVRALQERLTHLAENEKVTARLLELLAGVRCTGKQVHDANIVATMLVHGIDTLATINVDDFTRFVPQIAVVAL
ncbi:MAG: hypothetical protein L0I76_35090 [Pseudonocardia sp.]|nr:hypothetical protein [Pseudonocardia sp.]